MGKSNYWLSSGFFSMLHRGIDFLAGFIGFMMLIRIFNKTDFGVWVLFITIVSIIEMARNGFLQNGMIKFMISEYEKDISKVQMASLVLNTILTVFILILLIGFSHHLELLLKAPNLGYLLQVHCIALPFLIFHSHNLILMQGTFNFKAYFFAGISRSLPLFFFISYYFFSSEELTLPKLAWIYNLTLILAFLSSQYQVRNYFKLTIGWHKEWMNKIFHFGKFIFGTNLISMIIGSLDKFLLGSLISPYHVALANSAGRVVNLLDIPLNSISSISFPKASEAADNNDYKQVGKIFEFTVAAMLSFGLAFFLFTLLFAKQIILLVAGSDYLDAVPFLQLISIIGILKPFDRQGGIFLDAIGKPKYNMFLVLGTLIYSLFLSWFFISKFGLIGGAIGLVISLSITAIIKVILIKRFFNFSLKTIFYETIRNYIKIVTKITKRINIKQ